jgi:DnaJ-class molecular chaperone
LTKKRRIEDAWNKVDEKINEIKSKRLPAGANNCSMCRGTGIEKNTSHLTDEYGRVCPMCEGKGWVIDGY